MFYPFTVKGSGTYDDPRVQRILTKERGHFCYLRPHNMDEERLEKIACVYKTLKTALKNARQGFYDIYKGEIPAVFDSWTDKFYDLSGNVVGTGRWGKSSAEADEAFWQWVDDQQRRYREEGKKLGYI